MPRNGSADHRHDTGSVTPLVIGMMLCLLILGAGSTAAGSSFLAGQRTQHLCDGATAAAFAPPTGHDTGCLSWQASKEPRRAHRLKGNPFDLQPADLCDS